MRVSTTKWGFAKPKVVKAESPIMKSFTQIQRTAWSLSALLLLFAAVDTAAGDDYPDGKLSKALILAGKSQSVKIPHYAGLKPAKAITISAWIKPERVGQGEWGELGANKAYHLLQHHNGNKVDMEKLSKVGQREADLLAGFLTRLNETAQGDGSMLDHTMVLYGSGMNNGVGIEDGKGSHSTRKLPIFLAGGGKLGIKQGQHLVYENDRTPLCNLHVTLMQGMGLDRDHFVDGTGRLTGLSWARKLNIERGKSRESSVLFSLSLSISDNDSQERRSRQRQPFR